jgi:hypothetical protein
LWNSTNTAIDLGALLSGDFSLSRALAVDSAGNVFGIAYANDGVTVHAVEWVNNVPEPACLALMALAGLALNRRSRIIRAN